VIHSVPVCDKWPITTRLSRCAHYTRRTAAVAGLKILKHHSTRSCWKPKEEEKQERARLLGQPCLYTRPKVSSIFPYGAPWLMAPLKSLTHIIIDRDHYYICRPPISPTFFIYIPYINISSLGAPFHESNHHPRPSCYSIALCWTYAPNDWILREFQGWKDEGRRGAAAAGLLNALADGWGAWRHKTLHASPAKCCFLIVSRRERREEKKRVSQWRFN
jgi:hypothetical protein